MELALDQVEHLLGEKGLYKQKLITHRKTIADKKDVSVSAFEQTPHVGDSSRVIALLFDMRGVGDLAFRKTLQMSTRLCNPMRSSRLCGPEKVRNWGDS